MGYIISIMGVDGSGKSTLARELAKDLEAEGEKVVVVWGALRPVLMRPFIKLAKFLLVRKHDKYVDYEKHIEAKRTGMKKLSWTNTFSFWMVLIDYWPQVIYKVFIPRLAGRHVICDRYYHDLMIDYGITTNSPLTRIQKLIDIVRRVFPSPSVAYYLSITPDVAISRKDDIPHVGYLDERIKFYDAVATDMGISVLDGSASVDENKAVIVGDIRRLGARDG